MRTIFDAVITALVTCAVRARDFLLVPTSFGQNFKNWNFIKISILKFWSKCALIVHLAKLKFSKINKLIFENISNLAR